jgi:hypothetical protein
LKKTRDSLAEEGDREKGDRRSGMMEAIFLDGGDGAG